MELRDVAPIIFIAVAIYGAVFLPIDIIREAITIFRRVVKKND